MCVKGEAKRKAPNYYVNGKSRYEGAGCGDHSLSFRKNPFVHQRLDLAEPLGGAWPGLRWRLHQHLRWRLHHSRRPHSTPRLVRPPRGTWAHPSGTLRPHPPRATQSKLFTKRFPATRPPRLTELIPSTSKAQKPHQRKTHARKVPTR